MKTVFNQRRVEVVRINHGYDSVDSFVERANYLDFDQRDLTEAELELLTDQLQADGTMADEHFEHCLDRAEYCFGE